MTDEAIPQPNKKIGLNKKFDQKSNPSSEISQRIAKKEEVKNFENIAADQFSKIEDYKNRIMDLAPKFKIMIQNKTLTENKGLLGTSFEKEVIDGLFILASEMNADETQEECAGTNALVNILMKCLLFQRDRINSLEFEIDKSIKEIKSELAKSEIKK